MIAPLRKRSRARGLLFAFVLLLGLLPIGAVTADSHHTATMTDISFTSMPVELITPGAEWVDEEGTYHFENEVTREMVDGDINGELIATTSGTFTPGPSCDPDDPENCFEGEFTLWAAIVLTDENGVWEGDALIVQSFFEDDESFSFGKLALTGRGGNAGKSIIADLTLSEDDEEEAVFVDGYMLTMASPQFGVNMHTQICFGEEDLGYGAFVSTGAIETSGPASGMFISGGSFLTPRYGLYGETTFNDDMGSITIEFVGLALDHPETSVGWGHWVITDATGVYENVYGHGRVTGYAGDFPQCESGFGVWLQYLGQVHFN